jgi:regulator of RNase E activity RraA
MISLELLEAARSVTPAAIGHFVEDGALDPQIRAMVRPAAFAGRAVTVRIVVPDSAVVHRAVSRLQRDDVLVVDCGGSHRHAPVGELVALAAHVRGAAAIVIDGPCTDVVELQRIGLPVFARGASALTTKLLALAGSAGGGTVACGGVSVAAGDLVLGDENGVIRLPAGTAHRAIELARADEAEEGPLREAILSGGRLDELAGASRLLEEKRGMEP